MSSIEVITPWMIAKKQVKKVEITALLFASYVSTLTQAVNTRSVDVPLESAIRSARLMKQCVCIMDDGSKVNLDYVTLSSMPIPVAKRVIAALDDGEDLPTDGKPEILTDGDGVTSPILVKLGRPILATAPGAEDKSFSELEFQAKTYGDIERALGESNAYTQAISLLKTIAHPTNGMLALPSWVIDQISIADGRLIVDKIVPRFLE